MSVANAIIMITLFRRGILGFKSFPQLPQNAKYRNYRQCSEWHNLQNSFTNDHIYHFLLSLKKTRALDKRSTSEALISKSCTSAAEVFTDPELLSCVCNLQDCTVKLTHLVLFWNSIYEESVMHKRMPYCQFSSVRVW